MSGCVEGERWRDEHVFVVHLAVCLAVWRGEGWRDERVCVVHLAVCLAVWRGGGVEG